MTIKRYYSMTDIYENGLPEPLPQNYISIRKLVMDNKEIFKPVYRGEGRGRRYVIAGENINKFLATLNIKGNF